MPVEPSPRWENQQCLQTSPKPLGDKVPQMEPDFFLNLEIIVKQKTLRPKQNDVSLFVTSGCSANPFTLEKLYFL